VTLLVFLKGPTLLVGVGIVSPCPKILNDFKADVFEVDPLIFITSVTFLTYQVLALAGIGSNMIFKYSFDFLSSFHYLARLFFIMIWEVN